MAPRLRLFCAEGRSETVDLSERCGRRFAVKLARLRQISGSFVEVLGAEQATPLPNRRCKNRSVDKREAALVEEIPDGLLGFVPDPRDRALTRGSQPEVTVVEEKIDAVLFGLDRVVDRTLAVDRQILYAELESAR